MVGCGDRGRSRWGVWISFAPEARAGGWVNRRGLFEVGAGSTAAAVVGLIGALVSEAAVSIAGRPESVRTSGS